jgi:hypothetical protein
MNKTTNHRLITSYLTKKQIPHEVCLAPDSSADDEIVLGGRYDGISIQIGSGYYSLFVEEPDESFTIVEGHGKFAGELKWMLEYCDKHYLEVEKSRSQR